MAKAKKSTTATPTDPWAQRLEIEWFLHKQRAIPRPPPPSRQLKVGDRVVYGAVKSAEVLEVFQDGLSAVLKILFEARQGYGHQMAEVTEPRVVYWNEVTPLAPWSETRFTDEGSRSMWDKVRMVVTSMSSLIHMDRQWGFNDSPEYQRSYVWTDADKEALLDSIFASMDIGKFVIVQHPFPENRYEVLDGKQRLSTILDFTESRFPYKGVYYHEMHPWDRHTLTDHKVQYAVVDAAKMSRAERLRLFLAVNTAGVPVSEDHLATVRALYAEALAAETPNGGADR